MIYASLSNNLGLVLNVNVVNKSDPIKHLQVFNDLTICILPGMVDAIASITKMVNVINVIN
jgi:hypothetical protein